MSTLLKRAGAVIAAASIIAAGSVLPSSAETPDGYNAEMLAAVNAERANEGLEPLELWPGLSTVAYIHSGNIHSDSIGQEMTNELLESYHASGSQLSSDASAANCTPDGLAENLFHSNYVDATAAVNAYMNSESHRAAIMNPNFQFIGLGTFVGDDGRLFNTQRFATQCGAAAETESEFTNLDITRNTDGTLSFSLTLETGSGTIPQIEVFSPAGERIGSPSGYNWSEGVWVFEFNHNTPNVSGQYSFDYAGEVGENTAASATYTYDASTSVSGLPGTVEVPLGYDDVELATVTVSPGYGREVSLQEQVDGDWTTVADYTVEGNSGEVTLVVEPSETEVTRTYRVLAPQTSVAEAFTSAPVTVDFVAPDTIVSNLVTEINAEYLDAADNVTFSVNSEGPRDAYLLLDGEVVDSVEGFEGSASLELPRYEVGTHIYTLEIPGNVYGKPYSTDITVNVAKRTTTITEFEGTSEVYVGEAVEREDLLFFVNRIPGTEGIIEVLEGGEWVEAATFSVGQDHFTRASIPAVDEPGTYTYRATVTETATHTAAVSAEHTVEVSLYERNASSDAESHTYYLGDEAAEITVTADGAGEAVLQQESDGEWTEVESADLVEGSAILAVPAVTTVGEINYRVTVPQTATHEGWTGETFTVNAIKRDTTVTGWDAGDINISELETIEREITVAPANVGREVVLERSADEGETWEEVDTYFAPENGTFTVTVPQADLDTTFAYRVSVPESDLYNGTVSDVLTVTTQEFPTNVVGVPAIEVEMEYGSGAQSFDITLDNAYGRQVLLQRERTENDVSTFAFLFNEAADPNWVTVATYTAPNSETGTVTITIPEATEVGTTNYRVVVPEVTRGAGWVSDVFSVTVEPAESVIPGFSSSIYEIEDEGSTSFTTFAFIEGGEDRDRVAHLEELVDGEWVRVGGPFAQGANLDHGTFDEIVVLFPVDELGTSTYRVVVDPSDNYEGVVGNEFSIEVVRAEDNIDGDAPEETVVEVLEDEEIVIEYSSENARNWLVQTLNSEGEWVTIDAVANSTFVRYVVPTELVGNFTYRVVAEETDTLAEWVSETTTVQVTLQAPEVTGWEAQTILIGEGDTPEAITVTSDVPFTLQSQGLLDEWQDLETYEAGTHEINLPATAGVSYRLVVEETELTAGWTSGVIQVLNEVAIPGDEDDEVPGDDETPGGTDSDDDTTGGDNGDGTSTGDDDDRTRPTPVDNRRSTGTGNGVTTTGGATTTQVEDLEQTGSSALALTGIAVLALLAGAGALVIRNRKGSTT